MFVVVISSHADSAMQTYNKFYHVADYKPAELCFQMGILGKVSKVSNSEIPDTVQSPRVWFRRAVHINPSCARYWTMLQQGEANDPIE